MDTFTVTITNEHFESTEQIGARDQAAALEKSVKSALAIGAEQVAAGKPFFGAVVSLNRGEELLSRAVVSVGMSQLKT